MRVGWMPIGRFTITLAALVGLVCASELTYAAAPTLTAPGSPSAVAQSGVQINLSWTDTNTKENGYAIERSVSATSGFVEIARTAVDATTYQSTGLSDGKHYYFRVRAFSIKGSNTDYSPYASADASTPDVTPPSVPTNVTGSATSCGSVAISWSASSDNSSGVQRYEVFRNNQYLKQVLSPGTSATDSALLAQTLYYYSVRAVDNAGNSSTLTVAVGITTPACSTTTSTTSTSTSTSKPSTTSSTTSTSKPSSTTTTTTTAVGSTTSTTDIPPVAKAGPDQAAQSLMTLTFDGTGSYDPPPGVIVAYSWTFGDGATSAAGLATHAYATPGSYTATLRVTDNMGVAATDSAAVSVLNRAPVGNAGADQSGTVGGGMSFSGAGSSDPDGTITSYGWTFGDGSTGSGVTPPPHVYSVAGTYTVTLTVTDNLGATGQDTATVTVGGAGSTQWAKGLGGPGDDGATAVAVDGNGNVLVAGGFQGTATIGGQTLVSAGARDVFVAKFTAAGALVWVKRWGGAGDDYARGVAVDGAGNVLVVGYFFGTSDFGTGALTSAGLEDVFLAAYSGTTGAALWTRRAGSTGDDVAFAVAIDGSGNAVVTGAFMGTVDFGAGAVVAVSPSQFDTFVAKYTMATGACQWAKQFLNGSNDMGYGVAVDASGNIVLVGTFAYKIDFGGGILTSAGADDLFVAKLTSTGGYLWAFRRGGTDTDAPQGVALDASGNVFVTGYFRGTTDFGTGALVSQSWDGFVAKYAGSTGAALWTKRFGGSSADYGYAVAADPSGNAVVTGLFNGTVDFGTGALTSAGSADLMIVRYAATSGGATTAQRYGATLAEAGQAIKVSATGNVVVAGTYRDTVNFGTGPLTAAGLADGIVIVTAE